MWRGIALLFVVAACEQRHKPATYRLLVDKPVTIATEAPLMYDQVAEDNGTIPTRSPIIARMSTPAVAVNARGLLVAWEEQRPTERGLGRMVARRLTHDLQPIGGLLEIGNGVAPALNARSDGYVMGWIDHGADRSILLANIAIDSSISITVVAGSGPIFDSPSLTVIDGAVAAVACSSDGKDLVVMHEQGGRMAVERRSMPDGCNEPVIGGATARSV